MVAHIVLPWTRRVFANLNPWALCVCHGLSQRHLQCYPDDFTFRSLLAIAKIPATYNMLIKPQAPA